MSFEEFAHLAARFLVEEEEDVEAILRELKDAFRLYDREGRVCNKSDKPFFSSPFVYYFNPRFCKI